MKQFIVALSILSLAIFSFAGCGENTANNSKNEIVTIGTINLINGDLIARQEKWYTNELGMKVRVNRFDHGLDVDKAIEVNTVEIAQEGTTPAAFSISHSHDIEVIWIGSILSSAETLVAKQNSGITSVRDLVGKKVGTPFASTAHYSLLKALEMEGISTNDVTIIDLHPDSVIDAWKRDEIDAAYIWFPILEELYNDGGIAITDSGKLAEDGIVTADLNVVKKSFAEKHPEVVKKFIELQLRANDMIKNDPDRAATDIAEILGISVEDAKNYLSQYIYLDAEEQIDQLDNHMPEILKSTADFLVEQKSLDSAPDIEVFQKAVNSKYLKEVVQELQKK